ncbi:MAG: methyl-accepting chemotaxis protein [Gammaproteobacteria bacterium HGW-Gammaproteobacteria-11]|nr:MAG: methyl-accepting chemotaxis protein [Gammaproteobacteria bacterium HGW-Gammaproteobacteria-11]
MMYPMKISTRLMLGASLLTVLAVVLSSGFTGWQALGRSSQVVDDSVKMQFQAVAGGRATSLQLQLQSHHDLLLSTANNRMTQEAIYGFVRPFVSYRYEVQAPSLEALQASMTQWYTEQFQPLYAERTLGREAPFQDWISQTRYEGLLIQNSYVRDNPNPADQLAQLVDRDDATIYGQQHRRYHESYREITQRYGYHDLMLVDAASLEVIYSVSKGPVYATSLATGPFAESALAELVSQMRDQPDKDRFWVSDFSRFSGYFDQHVVFFAVPVFHPVYSPDKPLGFLVAQLPAERFTSIMTEQGNWQAIGLGRTGDAYLVADDGRLITEPRAMFENPEQTLAQLPLQDQQAEDITAMQRYQRLNGRYRISSPGVSAAIAGNSGIGLDQGLLGEAVLKSWQPLQIGGRNFALITEQAISESFGALDALRENIIMGVLLSVVILAALAALASWWLTRLVVKPLDGLALAIGQVARERDLRSRMPDASRDEIGLMAGALNQLFDTFAALVGRIHQSADATLAASARNVGIAQDCQSAAQRQQAALAAVDQQSKALLQAFDGIAVLVAQSAELARQADNSASLGQAAVDKVSQQVTQLSDEVGQSCQSMAELQKAAVDITSVLDTIESIAGQTNLLALNAAIEAARAGEQGRGFAVVADEVRRLARSTQDATGEIQQMLDRLRATVSEASAGLEREQASTRQCLQASAEASHLLVGILEQVGQISQATQGIDTAIQDENQRAVVMGHTLADIHRDAEGSARAMDSLAEIAKAQNQLALEGKTAASAFVV